MSDGILTRRGGSFTLQALAPTITEVSTTETSITFTITNNDAETAVILYEVGDTTPDANSIELAALATSGSITVSDLASDTAFDVYATVNVTGKIKSNVAELAITTDPEPIYTAATGGTTAEYDSGGARFKSHTFTSNGTFTVTTAGNGDRNKVDYLIIAGGGGGGGSTFARGGGGAGGYRTTNGTSGGNSSSESKVVVTAQGYTVTIGAGGIAGTGSGAGGDGGLSSVSFLSTISCVGGGGAALGNNSNTGRIGGSGGGGSSSSGTNGGTGTSNQGTNGFKGASQQGGAGGGAGFGAASVTVQSRQGGNGLVNTLRIGSNETRGGGGGGGNASTTSQGSGGSGGGGRGGDTNSSRYGGVAGTVNTGSGGGGGAINNGAAGGSGLVVIRYEIAPSV